MRSVAFGLICFLLGLVGGMGALSHSQVRLEAAAGTCKATGQGEGQWWYDVGGESMVSDRLQAPCYQIGASRINTRIQGIDLGWRAAWVDLGSYNLHEEAYGGVGVQPHWVTTGSGSIQGFSFGLIAEKPIWKFKLSADLGTYFYRSKWEAISTHYSHNVSVETNPDPRSGAAFYYGGGVGYTKKQLTFEASYRRYPNIGFNTIAPNFDNVGPTSASVNVGMVSARWSF